MLVLAVWVVGGADVVVPKDASGANRESISNSHTFITFTESGGFLVVVVGWLVVVVESVCLVKLAVVVAIGVLLVLVVVELIRELCLLGVENFKLVITVLAVMVVKAVVDK